MHGIIISLVLSALALASILRLTGASHGDECRCLSQDANCWPTAEEWNAFNVTIGGRLIAPKPTGKIQVNHVKLWINMSGFLEEHFRLSKLIDYDTH